MPDAWHKRMVGFDTETTGTDAFARVVEFGVCVWEDGRKVVNMSWLLNPGPLDLADPSIREAFEVNKLDPASLRDQPTFSEVFPLIRQCLEQAEVRVAHNAPFDQKMLRQEFQRAVAAGTLEPGQGAGSGKHATLDTLALDLAVNPSAKGHSLQATAERWKVQSGWQAHRASGDAEAAVRIMHAMAPSLPGDLVEVLARQKKSQAEWQARMDSRRSKK